MSSGRRALLIGNAAYPADAGLPDLRCPINDVDGIAAVLEDPAIGAFDSVTVLRDATSGEARRAIVGFARESKPEGTAVVYYSGHGKLDEEYRLHLCTNDSEVDFLEATSVPIRFVKDQLARCREAETVLILDCCFSGQAAEMQGRGTLDDQFRIAVRGTGTYLLTASDAFQVAQERSGELYGVFTKHLIAGLKSGAPDRAGRGIVTMDDLYEYLVSAVRADGAQRPSRAVGGHGEIVIAQSGRETRRERARSAEARLLALVQSGTMPLAVAGAVGEIAGKLPGALTPAEAEIDAALDQLLADKMMTGEFLATFFQLRNAPPKPEPKPEPAARRRPPPAEAGPPKAAAEPDADAEPEAEPAKTPRTRARNSAGDSAWRTLDKARRAAQRTAGEATAPPSGTAGKRRRAVLAGLLVPVGLVLLLLYAIALYGSGELIDEDMLGATVFISGAVLYNAFRARRRLGIGGWVTNVVAFLISALATIGVMANL